MVIAQKQQHNIHGIVALRRIAHRITHLAHLFKLDWVIMSIVILCIIAMVLYSILNLVEKKCLRGRKN